MVSLRIALTFVLFLALLASSPTAAPKFSEWSAPENLGPIVNSSSLDAGPVTSKDGLSLYITSLDRAVWPERHLRVAAE